MSKFSKGVITGKEVQKVFPDYNPKGKLRRTADVQNITNKNIKRIKEIKMILTKF